MPAGWHGDGVIARVGSRELVRELNSLRLPVVNVSGIRVPESPFPQVCNDLKASARLAAEHFLERGFRHFAYFSLMGLEYIEEHQQAFERFVTAAGGDFHSIAAKTMAGAEPDWSLDLAKLGQWLRGLVKPTAILTWNPSSAREVIYACQMAGILVPEEVAVLSGSDDDLLCDILQVPISGILVAAEQIGFEAARVLAGLMSGKGRTGKPIQVPARGVVTRQSTDTLAIKDEALARAVAFIRQTVPQPMQVRDVARHAGVSRRVLERRFVQILGRSPGEEIRRVQLERAKRLLEETDLPIPQVATAAGFSSPEYLAFTLRRQVGESPLRYRRSSRGSQREV